MLDTLAQLLLIGAPTTDPAQTWPLALALALALAVGILRRRRD